MSSSPRTAVALLLLSAALVFTGAAVLVVTVPEFKAAVKTRWHRFSAPALPNARSERDGSTTGPARYSEPALFAGLIDRGPNLHLAPDGSTKPLEGRTGSLIAPGSTPAITRVVEDVADSLVAISAGVLFTSPSNDPDLRITIRIDRADGSLVDWNEKRLRRSEHHPDTWERVNFEWLLRDLRVRPDDRVSIFLRNLGGEEVYVDGLDIVFRGPVPFKLHTPNA